MIALCLLGTMVSDHEAVLCALGLSVLSVT